MNTTILLIVFPVLGAIFLFLFTKRRIQKANAGSLLFKTLTSVCFLGLAFCGTAGKPVGYPFFITAGLFFGLLGDIWLDLKYNSPEQADAYTFAGFWCFAVGHVFFLIALIGFGGVRASLLWIILPFAVAAAAGIVIGMGGKLLSLDYGKFKTITMFYGAVLISSSLICLSLLIRSGFSSLPLILFFIGAILFLISDLILSGTYFGQGKNRPVDIISNHVFYYAAQFLIAASAVVFTG